MPHAALLSLVTQTDGPQQGQRYPHDWTMHFSHEHLYLCVVPVKPISMTSPAIFASVTAFHRFRKVRRSSRLSKTLQVVIDLLRSLIGCCPSLEGNSLVSHANAIRVWHANGPGHQIYVVGATVGKDVSMVPSSLCARSLDAARSTPPVL